MTDGKYPNLTKLVFFSTHIFSSRQYALSTIILAGSPPYFTAFSFFKGKENAYDSSSVMNTKMDKIGIGIYITAEKLTVVQVHAYR
jgi:hypothetical protein